MFAFIRRHSALLVVLLLALLLRLPLLDGSFWLDEAAQALEADRPFSQQLNLVDDFQPPLLHLITFVAIQFSHSQWWLRLVGALIPGLLTIWGTYLIGHKLVSKKVGLLAALFLATSSFHIFFSQELRPYSLSSVFVIWSWFFLLESKSVGQDIYQLSLKNPINNFFNFFPVSRDFFLFLLCSLAGLYSSYLYPFVLASQVIFLALKKKWHAVLYACLIPIIGFLPWLNMFFQQLAAGQALRSNFPGWESIVSFGLLRAPVLTFGKFLFGVLDIEVNSIFIFITSLFVFLVLLILFSRKTKFFTDNRRQLTLWLYFLILPFVLATLTSFFVPVIQPKRVIFLLPFVYLFLSFLILGTHRDWQKLKFFNWLLLILVLSINLFSTISYWKTPHLQRENWQHGLIQLHRHYDSSNTLAIFAYSAPFSPWSWYERQVNQPFPTLSTGSYDTSKLSNLDQLLLPAKNYQYLIVFDYLRSLTDRENLLPQILDDFGFHQSQIYDYPNLGFIRIYSK